MSVELKAKIRGIDMSLSIGRESPSELSISGRFLSIGERSILVATTLHRNHHRPSLHSNGRAMSHLERYHVPRGGQGRYLRLPSLWSRWRERNRFDSREIFQLTLLRWERTTRWVNLESVSS